MPTVKEALQNRVRAHVAAAEADDTVKRDQDQLTADQQAAVSASAEADKNDAIVTAIVGAVGEVVDDDGTTYQILGGKLHEFTPRRAADVTVDVVVNPDGSITVSQPPPPEPPAPEPAPPEPPAPDVDPTPAPPEPAPEPNPDVNPAPPEPAPDNPNPPVSGVLDEPDGPTPRGRRKGS